MAKTEINETQHLLKKWANWRLYGNPYPSQSSIQAFREGGMGGVFASKPPPGTQMPEGVGVIIRAMKCAEHPAYGRAQVVQVVREYWLVREAKVKVKDYVFWKQLPESVIYSMKDSGEGFIAGFIAGAQEYEVMEGMNTE